MFSYLLFFVRKHAKSMAHMAHMKNFLLQICFSFDFLVYSSIHTTKNPLSSNNWLRCHATHNSITLLFGKKRWGRQNEHSSIPSWLIASLILFRPWH